MKTAMTLAFERLEIMFRERTIDPHWHMFKDHYLEKEKEQLIKAHIDGFDNIVVDFKKQEYAEQYFNEIYQNK